MSIFPKRTLAGNTVTIHWNLTLPAGMVQAVCPYVRMSINTPDGRTHLLFEGQVLLLPSTAASAPPVLQQAGAYQYLNKHTPLLVLASYLSGKQSREKLVEILTNIQNGRHYYFTWAIPPDALPGKYTLLSEMYLDGTLKHSGTAADDFFYVEQLHIVYDPAGEAIVHNPGPEPVPVKLITYTAGRHQQPEDLEVGYINAGDRRSIDTTGKSIFLVYNEERITIPLHTAQQPRSLRNQQYHALDKEEVGESVTYVLPRTGEAAWRLTGVQQTIWQGADGMTKAEQLRATDNNVYDELLAQGLIIEIP